MQEQKCPLCNGIASFSGHDFGRRKGFSCKICTEFIISLSAEKRLKEAPQKWKEQLSTKAKLTPEGQVLVITIPSIHQPGSQTTEALQAKYQPRQG